MVLRRQTKLLLAVKHAVGAGLSNIEREKARGLIERLTEDVKLLHRMVAAPAGCLRAEDDAWNEFLDGQALYLARLLDYWRIVGDALRLDVAGEAGEVLSFTADPEAGPAVPDRAAESLRRRAN